MVEDSPADAELIADCFEGSAIGIFELAYVARIDTAIVELSHARFDCVLLDLSLPDSRGLEGVRRIRESAAHVPLVVLTGLNDSAVGEDAVRLGVQDFLVKSELTGPTFQRSVRYAIERHRQQAAISEANTAVQKARARFQRAFDSAPTGMALVRLDGHFTEVNPRLVEMVNYLEPQLLAMFIHDVVHVDDLEAFALGLKRLVEGDRDPGVFRAECRLVGLADRQVWALISVAVVDDGDGQAAYVIVQAEDITTRKDAEARLVHQTLHDPLTGLPNRLLLQDRIEHALNRLDRAESIALFYLDLDRFKLINDTLGHGHGDALIVEVGRRLCGVVRPGDTVARLGGDEFVVLAENLYGRDDAVSIAERLRTVLRASIALGGVEIVPSASIGVAFATERHKTPELLLREADTAMYRAKERGKDRFEIFDDALRAKATKRLGTEALIRRAIDDDLLAVVYQPVVSLSTRRVVGVEALMRIDDRKGGLVLPGDFISTAEDTGLIVPMGRWVLTKAVEEAARWLERGSGAPFRINVNLSARQLSLPGLIEDIASILAANSVPAEHLCLELTETVFIDAAASTVRSLTGLKDLGVGLGIDDFGTGYSSLTYLRRFPVDFIKIDKSFVAGAPENGDDVAIVRAVTSLGQALGLTTIAEGVETEAQLELVTALGCDLAQGYLLGAPQPSVGPADLGAECGIRGSAPNRSLSRDVTKCRLPGSSDPLRLAHFEGSVAGGCTTPTRSYGGVNQPERRRS